MEQKSKNLILEVMRYGIVGAVSTVIDIGLLKLITMAGSPYWLALAFGFAGGTVNGYFMNSRWTFKYKTAGKEGLKFSQFTIVSIIGLALTEIIGNSYIGLVNREISVAGFTVGAQMVGKLIAVVIVFAWNYLGNKYWTFSKK